MTDTPQLTALRNAVAELKAAAAAFQALDPNDPDFLDRADEFASLLAHVPGSLGDPVLGSNGL